MDGYLLILYGQYGWLVSLNADWWHEAQSAVERQLQGPHCSDDVFIFVFCATINHYGLSKFISLWFITRKFVTGKPWVFTFVFLASIFLLGGLTSASPAAIIGWKYFIRDLRFVRL